MTWVRLDDGFVNHPKVAGLSNTAFRVHIAAMCYSARYQLDGKLPDDIGRILRARRADIVELVSAGLWDVNGTGWAIHDYLDYNPSRDETEAQRKLYQARATKAAKARWKGAPKDA